MKRTIFILLLLAYLAIDVFQPESNMIPCYTFEYVTPSGYSRIMSPDGPQHKYEIGETKLFEGIYHGEKKSMSAYVCIEGKPGCHRYQDFKLRPFSFTPYKEGEALETVIMNHFTFITVDLIKVTSNSNNHRGWTVWLSRSTNIPNKWIMSVEPESNKKKA